MMLSGPRHHAQADRTSEPTDAALSRDACSILDPFDFAAIHSNGSAREPTSLLGNQVCHQAGNFFRFTIAGNARLFWKLLHGLCHVHPVGRRPFIEERPPAARHHRTWHYAVDLDSILN